MHLPLCRPNFGFQNNNGHFHGHFHNHTSQTDVQDSLTILDRQWYHWQAMRPGLLGSLRPRVHDHLLLYLQFDHLFSSIYRGSERQTGGRGYWTYCVFMDFCFLWTFLQWVNVYFRVTFGRGVWVCLYDGLDIL